MATFSYKALDSNGRFVVGEIEAADPRDVSRQLEKLGYVALDAAAGRRASSEKAGRWLAWSRPVGRREVTVFLRELSLVLRAGLPLDEALLLLAGEERRGLAAVLRDLRSAISAGSNFADALQRHPRLFGSDLVAIVRVAEAAGNLDVVLEAVGQERSRTEQLLDKIANSLRYPAVLLLIALLVLVFFLVVVVPQFAAVLRDFGQQPGGVAGLVLALSGFLVANGDVLAGAVAVLMAASLIALRRPAVRLFALRQFGRLPGLRGVLELRRTVLFCSSLATLLGNGVPLASALKVLVDLPGAAAGGFEQVVAAVRGGSRLVDALGRVGYLPPLALKMLRVGEESGELAVVARRTAEFYETKLTDRLDRMAGVVGPAAIVVIAGVVGLLIVSILSALLDVNQLVS